MHSAWLRKPVSDFWNFPKLKREDLISWWEPILQNGWTVFPSHFCISVLKVLRTQIFCHSLALNVFCMIEGVPFSEVWNFDKLKTGAPESCTIHRNLMSQEEFWSLKLLKWKYRMGDQIIALFFKIGSSQEIRSSPPL